jgi:hypothetical protein
MKAARLAHDVHVQVSLPVAGVLRDVQSAFFGLSIDAGKAVLAAMMEAERARCAARKVVAVQRALPTAAGTPAAKLCWAVVAIARPRARGVAAGELSLPTFAWAAHADPLERATIVAIAAGVSTRRYECTLDPPAPCNRIDQIVGLATTALSNSVLFMRSISTIWSHFYRIVTCPSANNDPPLFLLLNLRRPNPAE